MKPWLVMHQLGLDFELALIDVLSGQQKSQEFLGINGLGVVPYLITDSGQGIGESNAMLWYLAHDSFLIPKSKIEQAEALQWMFFEQSKLEPYLSPARFFNFILPQERTNRASDIASWQESARPGLCLLDKHLGTRQFMLASGYSIADISVFGYVHVLEEAGLSLEDYPQIARWINEITQTDGFLPLSALGDPQSIAA